VTDVLEAEALVVETLEEVVEAAEISVAEETERCTKLFALNVVRIVKFLSDLVAQSLSTVVIVSKEKIVLMVVVHLEAEMTEAETLEAEIQDAEKTDRCTKQFVMNVVRIVKFLSDQVETNQSTAATVLVKTVDVIQAEEILSQNLPQIKKTLKC
jgi:predicted adenine nucleotide alpha hydrolase (AANH) superfamily ATPase